MELKDYEVKGTTVCECGHEFTMKDYQELERIEEHGFYANQVKHYSKAICPDCKKEVILLLKQKGQTYVIVNIASKKKETIENIVTEATRQIEEEKETTQEFICPTCKKVCKNQLGLNAHMRTHTN